MRIDVYHHVGDERRVMTVLTTLLAKGDQLMAQVDDLKAILMDVNAKVDGVATEVADLIAKLQAQNQNPAVDLGEEIALATQIQGKLSAIPAAPTA